MSTLKVNLCRETTEEMGMDFEDTSTRDPLDAIIREDFSRLIWETADRKLSQRQRQCFRLYYKDDLTIKQVAAAINLSEGSVKYHLWKSREKIRRYVRDYCDYLP